MLRLSHNYLLTTNILFSTVSRPFYIEENLPRNSAGQKVESGEWNSVSIFRKNFKRLPCHCI